MINTTEITGGWKMYKFPFATMPVINNKDVAAKAGKPAIYSGNFNVVKEGDVFLDMKKWDKGIVFVNGYNLGRYWNIGPQQTLYLPGAFLKKGKNEIVVFEQINDNIKPEITSVAKPILTDLEVSK